ncbi:hypothetical protein VTL71DRAFT_16316 [Oculimacula yallundae]|uniref:Uncharacterized protein n=1 Tax=Oculimacula yallundae TaxID=86028 RepID=A0ABR4CE96_9HELO
MGLQRFLERFSQRSIGNGVSEARRQNTTFQFHFGSTGWRRIGSHHSNGVKGMNDCLLSHGKDISCSLDNEVELQYSYI